MEKSYEERITEEFNKWTALYDKATETGTAIDQGVASFMCAAISQRVYKSTQKELKEYFEKWAR